MHSSSIKLLLFPNYMLAVGPFTLNYHLGVHILLYFSWHIWEKSKSTVTDTIVVIRIEYLNCDVLSIIRMGRVKYINISIILLLYYFRFWVINTYVNLIILELRKLIMSSRKLRNSFCTRKQMRGTINVSFSNSKIQVLNLRVRR